MSGHHSVAELHHSLACRALRACLDDKHHLALQALDAMAEKQLQKLAIEAGNLRTAAEVTLTERGPE